MLDPLSHNLDQYMTLVSVRQKLVASNVANADTPGYKTQDIDFESELQNAVSGAARAGSPSPLVNTVPGLRIKNDGNNVDLDREARLLAENALRFSVASNLLRSQIKTVRMAIEGGSGSTS
jgi:flagellar basal-body rod protein FlgB